MSIAILFIIFASFADANPINYTPDDPPIEHVSVWTGQNLSLSCEDEKDLAPFHRLWRKESQLLSAATVVITLDKRFNVINEHVLLLNNVTSDDKGEYVCEIVTNPLVTKKFMVSVVEVICGEPIQIPNGLLDPAPGTVDTYRYGDQVVYSCIDGYAIVGSAIRTCLHPESGWEGEIPSCQLQELADVNTRMNKVEHKLQKLLSADLEIFHKVEEKFSDLEGRVKSLEGETSDVINNRNKNELMEREVHHLKTAMTQNALRDPWETFLKTEVARMGVSEGKMVSEFTWFVKDFDQKMAQYRDLNFDYITSPTFYTHVPGYHMVLHIYPNYDQTDHVGFFAILIPGRFDDTVAWPFTSKYMLSIGTVNAEASDVFDTIIPARTTECKFGKPPPDNDIGCGFAAFLEHKVLKEKAHLHKSDGGVIFRITIFLDD